MNRRLIVLYAFILFNEILLAQNILKPNGTSTHNHSSDTVQKLLPIVKDNIASDSTPTVSFRDVNIIYFKTNEGRMMYYKYKSRIQKVLPYVKIAKQLYTEMKEEKENDKKRDYRHYRKDLEREMRARFENELKDLTTSQGEMLFKLINRETKNNAYSIIKELKGSITAWFYELVGKRWGYDLKENYDPQKEHLIEMIIKEMGPAYNVDS